MFDAGLIDMVMRLRGKGISDNSVLRAIELTPRRRFVPSSVSDKAYDEQSLPIACGQTITAEVQFAQHDVLNVVMRHGDGRYGWAGQAPFDRIILGCATRAAPPMLLDQLAPKGEMIAVVDEQLMRFTKARSVVKEETIMPMKLDMIEPGSLLIM